MSLTEHKKLPGKCDGGCFCSSDDGTVNRQTLNIVKIIQTPNKSKVIMSQTQNEENISSCHLACEGVTTRWQPAPYFAVQLGYFTLQERLGLCDIMICSDKIIMMSGVTFHASQTRERARSDAPQVRVCVSGQRVVVGLSMRGCGPEQ